MEGNRSATGSINDLLASEFPGLARADTGSVENTANRVTIRPLGLCTKFLSKLELTVLRRMIVRTASRPSLFTHGSPERFTCWRIRLDFVVAGTMREKAILGHNWSVNHSLFSFSIRRPGQFTRAARIVASVDLGQGRTVSSRSLPTRREVQRDLA